MHRTALMSGTISMLLILAVVLMLAAGFGVDLAQALSQSAPIALATGLAVSLGAAVLSREIA